MPGAHGRGPRRPCARGQPRARRRVCGGADPERPALCRDVSPPGRGPPRRPARGLGQRCPGGGDRGGTRPPRRRPGGTRRGAAHRRGGEQNLPATRPCPGWAVSDKRPRRRSARLPGPLLAGARGFRGPSPDPGRVVGGGRADEQRAESVQARQPGLTEPLTDRELTILRLLPAPTPQRELASALFVTPNTLRTHLRAIYRKLGAESRDDAVIRARERGLI